MAVDREFVYNLFVRVFSFVICGFPSDVFGSLSGVPEVALDSVRVPWALRPIQGALGCHGGRLGQPKVR